MALADLPIAAIEHAAGAAMRECEFFPAPARLRALASPFLRQRRTDQESREPLPCDAHFYDKAEWLETHCTPRCPRHGQPVANLIPTISAAGQLVLVPRTGSGPSLVGDDMAKLLEGLDPGEPKQ